MARNRGGSTSESSSSSSSGSTSTSTSSSSSGNATSTRQEESSASDGRTSTRSTSSGTEQSTSDSRSTTPTSTANGQQTSSSQSSTTPGTTEPSNNAGSSVPDGSIPDVQPAADLLGSAVDWAAKNPGQAADVAASVLVPGYLGMEMLTGGKFGASSTEQQWEKAQQAAEQRQRKFDNAQRDLGGNGPVATSDELLDDGKLGLEFFERFIPVFQDWTGSAPDYQGEIVGRYDELRGIDFAAFRDDARRLSEAHSALTEQNDAMRQGFQHARQTWKGSASEAAAGKVDGYLHGGSTVVSEAERAAGAITPAIDGIQQTIRDYAKFVLDFGKDVRCAGKTPDEARDEIRKARGDVRPGDFVLSGFGPWQDAVGSLIVGMALPVVAPFFVTDAARKIRDGIINDAKQWLDNSFSGEFEQKFNTFRQQTTSTHNSVQQAYDQMLEAAKVSDDPFRQSGQQQPSATEPSGSTGQSGGDAGAGSGSGGGGTPGAAVAPPGAGGGTPGGGMPGGEPSSRQDGAGAPKDERGGREQLEKVTLGEGKNAVTVREPDAKGNLEVTVLGENGQPKTYEVAFGDGSAGTGGGLQPGAPGERGSVAGAGDPGVREPMNGEPVRQQGETSRVQAGPDGRAVIQEGDRTITLERTPDGDLKLNVAEGVAQPGLSQTIDFGDEPESGSSPTEQAPQNEVREQPEASPLAGAVGSPPEPPVAETSVSSPAGEPAAPPVSASTPEFSQPTVTPTYTDVPDEPAAASAASTPLAPDTPATTTAQWAGLTSIGSVTGEGMQNSFGSMSGQLFDAADMVEQRLPGEPSDASTGATDLASMQDTPVRSSTGSTDIAGIGDSPGGRDNGSGGTMGAMSGIGETQQSEREQQRDDANPWRTVGDLFEEGIEQAQQFFGSIIGEDRK